MTKIYIASKPAFHLLNPFEHLCVVYHPNGELDGDELIFRGGSTDDAESGLGNITIENGFSIIQLSKDRFDNLIM